MTKEIRLHDYQIEIKARLMEEWRIHRSVMMQMPTGTGKTHVLAAVVKEYLMGNKGTIWMIAHRRELVAQAEETMEQYGISKTNKHIRVMAIQWLARHWEEMKEMPSLVIIDEAHHAQAKTYRMLWERCPKAQFLGLTATPCRMNKCGFTDLFEVLICSWSIASFIEKNRLSTFDYISICPNSREQQLIDSLEKRGADGDYQIQEMNKVLNKQTNIKRLYESVRKYANYKKGIVYAISIDHAKQIAEYYNRQGIHAIAIDSKTPTVERKRLVEEFKAGKIQILVNVDVFSEGFDCPDVEFVQMARPTLSLAKYLQQVGRGLRKSNGKDRCILIDNVGLYRIFGLPTVPWNWEAMFCGEQTGKGKHVICQQKEYSLTVLQEEQMTQDSEMEVIVSHENLLSMLAEQKKPVSVQTKEKTALKSWQDKESGLWGLQQGRKKTTEAVFSRILDIRYEMAAVRCGNKSCKLLNANGETIWEKGRYQSMKFTRNYFLMIRTQDGKEHYLDLHSLRMYERKPEIKRYGNVELLKIGHVYYSRTKTVYVNNQNINSDYISIRKFGITILDCRTPASCCTQTPYMEEYRWGYACILNDDYESFYWIYRWLADGSIIVKNDADKYYHTKDDKEKVYIGCCESATEKKKCLTEIERIVQQAMKTHLNVEAEKTEKRKQILNSSDEAIPFRSGMKWGLKVGNRITVPPIYRNIKSPVGKYCAVEKNYSQWGVIALDGTLMVEPQYSNIEISTQGIVTGTKVTGSKVSVKLP